MSWMEISLIVAAVAVPIITLFMVLPKKKKEAKADKPAEKEDKPKDSSVADTSKKDENSASTAAPKEDKGKTIRPVFDNAEYKPEDFKDYLKEKSSTISKPKRKVMDKKFGDFTQSWEDFIEPQQPAPKTLADDICCLSQEIQAMIFAGLLDRKY